MKKVFRLINHSRKSGGRRSGPGVTRASDKAVASAPSDAALTVEQVEFLTSRFDAKNWDETADADNAAEQAAKKKAAALKKQPPRKKQAARA